MSWLDKPSYTDFEGSQVPVEEPAGFFEGSLEMVPRGLGSAALRVGELTGTVTATVLGAMGDEDADAYWKKVEQRRNWRMELGENRKGTLANVGGAVVEYGSLALANLPGGVSTIFATEAETEIAAGRSLSEASQLAAIRAGALYVGAKIPASLAPKYGLGKTLGYGAAANVGVGVTQRGGEHLVIGDEAPEVFDPEALAIDATLGALFGAHGYRVSRKSVDAALDRRGINKAHDSAPTIPANGEALDIHMQALADTIKSTETGIPPDYAKIPIGEADPRVAEVINRTAPELESLAKTGKTTDAAYGVEEISLTPEQFASYHSSAKPVTKEDIREAVRSELQTFQNMVAISGRAPEQSWVENTRVTGADKAPIVIYRGSADGETRVEDFSEDRIGAATGHPSSGLGVWFSADKGDAAGYGKVGEYHLDIRKPKVYSIETFPGFDSIQESAALRKKLIQEGHDGIVIDARDVGGPVQFVAFKPESVIKRPAEMPKPAAKAAPKQVAEERPPLPEVEEIQAKEPDLEAMTVVTPEGDAVSGAEFAKRIEAEKQEIDTIIDKMTSVMQCLVRSANV